MTGRVLVPEAGLAPQGHEVAGHDTGIAAEVDVEQLFLGDPELGVLHVDQVAGRPIAGRDAGPRGGSELARERDRDRLQDLDQVADLDRLAGARDHRGGGLLLGAEDLERAHHLHRDAEPGAVRRMNHLALRPDDEELVAGLDTVDLAPVDVHDVAVGLGVAVVLDALDLGRRAQHVLDLRRLRLLAVGRLRAFAGLAAFSLWGLAVAEMVEFGFGFRGFVAFAGFGGFSDLAALAGLGCFAAFWFRTRTSLASP